jgi:hypothetical protein
MKKILFVLSIIGILSSCSEDKDSNFTLKGNVEGMRKGMVYLKQDINGQLVTIDSLFLKGTDAFEFKGNIESPEVLFLTTSRRNSSTLPIFIEKSEIIIDADVSDILSANITGSENQELLDQFNKIVGRFNMRKNELYVEGLNANNKEHFITLQTISNKYERNEIKKTKYILNFAVSNGEKEISPYIALNYLSSSDITVLDTINKSMSSEVKNSKYGKELNELVTQIKATTIGSKFPKIVQPDSTGTNFSLENKNGFLLVRFWASYDQNSRIGNSLSKKRYENYSDEDLKIISISLDTDKESWINALNEDKIPWLELSDLKGNKNEAVRKLAIRVIPENILIDKNGIIVGRNLMAADILKIVDEYLKNKENIESN